MATIIIHAGMPKTGSTAIQEFLAGNGDLLAKHSITVAVASRARHGPDPIAVRPYKSGAATSWQAAQLILKRSEETPAIMSALVNGLKGMASESATVVMTAEGLAHPIWRNELAVLRPLDGLAEQHEVRVAYYVRPQHTALEAAWRQWGFRTGRRPADYIAWRAEQLHYYETVAAVGEVAPAIDFVVRPFRSDLLDSGDVVVDFGRRLLGLDEGAIPASRGNRANVGLSLELTNLLSRAPEGFFGNTPHQNRRFNQVKTLLKGLEAETSDSVKSGRTLLQGWCHQRFESSNRRLIEACGWPADDFVPATTESVDDLAALDELWRPSASEAESEAFFKLLDLQLGR